MQIAQAQVEELIQSKDELGGMAGSPGGGGADLSTDGKKLLSKAAEPQNAL
jgi:hypothetical protein